MPNIDIRLSRDEGTPPYLQIKEQMAAQIKNGTLPVEQKLPSIRTLATQLGVAPRTVARVYKELHDAGLIFSEARRGSRVRGADGALSEASAQAKVFIADCRRAGLSLLEAKTLVQSLWDS